MPTTDKRKAANLWLLSSVTEEIVPLLKKRESLSSLVEELLQEEIGKRRTTHPINPVETNHPTSTEFLAIEAKIEKARDHALKSRDRRDRSKK